MSYGYDETKASGLGSGSNLSSSSSSSLNSNAPAPLPMYQRVVLKHVPTMVRRRYDSDLDNLIHGLPSEDSSSEGDGVEDIPDFAANDVDDGSDDKAEDDGQSDDPMIGKCNTNQDTQTCTEDFGLSTYMEDNKKEDDGPGDVSLVSLLEAIDTNRNQKNGPAKCDNVQVSDVEDNRWDNNGTKAVDIVSYSEDEVAENVIELEYSDNKVNKQDNCKSEGDEIKNVNVADYCVNDSDKAENNDAENRNFDDKQGVLLEDSKSLKEAASCGNASVNTMDIQDEGLETEPVIVTENSVTMTFGKNAKKENHSPLPLPMYQRVTLKHVPTMVRRRYDKALHKFEASAGGASNDSSESRGDPTAYANPAYTLSEMDNSTGYEAEDVTKNSDTLAHCDINDAQTYTEDFCGNDFEPSASMCFEVGKSENDGTEVENLFSSVDDDGKDIIQVNGHEKTDSDKVMYSEDGKSESDVAEEVNLFSSVDDDAKDIIHVNGHEKSDSDEGIYLEYGKGANDGAKEVDFSSSVDKRKNIILVNGHANSESDEASCSKDCTSEDDEAKEVNFTDSLNAWVDKEVQDNELDLESEGDGTKDTNVASSCVDDSAEDEVQEKKHESSNNNHGLQTEHCKSKGDGRDAATYYGDGCVKDDVQDKGVNFDSKCDLPVQNVESQGNGTGDKYLATANHGMKDHSQGVKDSYCEHDFNPEAFKKTIARDGYELCCPNCKHYITETIILRRKEYSQQCQTTCFSCVTALFRCIQW